MIKSNAQKDQSFGDFWINPKNLETRKKEFFQHLNKMINWRPLEYRIEKLYCEETGRPGFPALVMFKALLLAQRYSLSDPELWSKVEHPFQVLNCQWKYEKVRYSGLHKNTMQMFSLLP